MSAAGAGGATGPLVCLLAFWPLVRGADRGPGVNVAAWGLALAQYTDTIHVNKSEAAMVSFEDIHAMLDGDKNKPD